MSLPPPLLLLLHLLQNCCFFSPSHSDHTVDVNTGHSAKTFVWKLQRHENTFYLVCTTNVTIFKLEMLICSCFVWIHETCSRFPEDADIKTEHKFLQSVFNNAVAGCLQSALHSERIRLSGKFEGICVAGTLHSSLSPSRVSSSKSKAGGSWTGSLGVPPPHAGRDQRERTQKKAYLLLILGLHSSTGF